MSFALSKILWILLSPASLLVLLLATGLMLENASRGVLKKTGRILCFFVFFCLAAMAILPVGDWALAPLENRFASTLPNRVDGIIIVGGDENTQISEARGEPTALDSMRRYVMFSGLAQRYPNAELVFSGGSPFLNPPATMLDSEVAQKIMAVIGVPTGRVVFERKSRNTHENAVFSANLVHPEHSQNWLLVTSAWHMPRAMGCFRKAGWNIFAAPTGYFTTGEYRMVPVFRFEEQLHLLTLAAHEYVGLVFYWLTGRTNALWPG